ALGARHNLQVAGAVETDVFGAVGVVLELGVAPAAAAAVEGPLVAVDGGAGRAVELVAPGERPARRAAAAAATAAAAAADDERLPARRDGPVGDDGTTAAAERRDVEPAHPGLQCDLIAVGDDAVAGQAPDAERLPVGRR